MGKIALEKCDWPSLGRFALLNLLENVRMEARIGVRTLAIDAGIKSRLKIAICQNLGELTS
jgi:hypothetical protein